MRDSEDREIEGQETAVAIDDPFTVPVPSAMDMHDELMKRRGEGRYKTLAMMISETRTADRQD